MVKITRAQDLVYKLKIKHVMTPEPVTVSPQQSMGDAKELMRVKRISGLPVVDGGVLIGIVSLEDIIKALEAGAMTALVAERMTPRPLTLYADESVIQAVNKFSRYPFGRFPVVDRQGRLVGILTKGDIVRGLLKAIDVDYNQEEPKAGGSTRLFDEVVVNDTTLVLRHAVRGRDIQSGGEGSSKVRTTLELLGVASQIVRRAAIAAYEAEMNIILHADSGHLISEIKPDRLMIKALDRGPGIADIEQAMQPGFSTAPEWVRELGFGAGMGLTNIQRCADRLRIRSTVGKGTRVEIEIRLKNEEGRQP